jgi:outer membrane protein assembly factor BamB
MQQVSVRWTVFTVLAVSAWLGWSAPLAAADWPSWRGPAQTGVAEETGLVSDWSPGGKNQIWKVEFTGRSTPVVTRGQVCVIGRVGKEIEKQEVVACFDEESGALRWEHRIDVYHTTVAFNRVGWASLVADPETGNVYAHGVAGQLIGFAPDGEILWSHFLTEAFGRLSGYGGRTQTPLVDGDLLLLTFVSSGWGNQAAPRHRYQAFDKRTGELIWVTTPGGMPYDMNTQSAPVVAEIEGRRLLVAGNADGKVYALDVATGEPVWSFALSRRGLNSTVLVVGNTVFASHSEENLDEPTMGRVVAFRGTGRGALDDQELWRVDELAVGFSSPAYLDGKLYVVDNSANLYRIDAKSGKVEREFNLGTVGKASPVLADGKIYVPETNGRFHILRDNGEELESLSSVELGSEAEGRYSEIYGSAAVAYGRIYLSTEHGLYCIGDPQKKFRVKDTTRIAALPAGEGDPAAIAVRPAEVLLAPGESVAFRARLYDGRGFPLEGAVRPEWKLEGIEGELSPKGRLRVPTSSGPQAGKLTARSGALIAEARVRVIPPLPWSEDFGSYADGAVPPTWIGARGKYEVTELEGEKVLVKLPRERGLLRNPTFMGGDFSDYTIEADVMGGQVKRRKTDVGLLNSGYTLDLLGNHQRLEVRAWTAERRMAQAVDFPWEMGVWYRMKFQVRVTDGRGMVRGKVWKRGEAEPGEWTLSVTDPVPVESGSPGLTGYSPAEVYYDNVKVMVNR